MPFRRDKRPWWEYGVIVICVLLSITMTLAISFKRDQLYKSRLLLLELETLRKEVVTHLLTTKHLPKNLEELENVPQMDFFGNPYHYNPQTGWVSSTTEGFEHW